MHLTSTLAFLAAFLKYMRRSSVLMSTRARSAYAIYVVHYVFVLWIQYSLLEMPLLAGVKFAISFASALVLSQATASLLLRIPALRAEL